MRHLKDFIYRYLKDSNKREEEITAKNHHLVQDCLVGVRRNDQMAHFSARCLLVWLLMIKQTLLDIAPSHHTAHNNILGGKWGKCLKKKVFDLVF